MIKKTFYTLAEVTHLLGIENESTVRYYVKQFRLDVPKRAGKLSFSAQHVERLKKIVALRQEEKFTIDGAKTQLKQQLEEGQFHDEVLGKLQNVKRLLSLLSEYM